MEESRKEFLKESQDKFIKNGRISLKKITEGIHARYSARIRDGISIKGEISEEAHSRLPLENVLKKTLKNF